MASSQATTSEVSAIAHWNTKIYLKSQKKKAGEKNTITNQDTLHMAVEIYFP